MSGGRPRTAIGTFGTIRIRSSRSHGYIATTRFRDLDGRLRLVTATARTGPAARAALKERMVRRPGYGSRGILSLTSSFADLTALWLADLDAQDLVEAPRTTTASTCACTSCQRSSTTPWARSPPAGWSRS